MEDLHSLNRSHQRQLSRHANNLVEIFLGHIYKDEEWYPFKNRYDPFKW